MSVKLRAVYEEVDAPRVQTPDTPDTTISYGHVLQASWHHGEVVNRTELINRFRSVGIVVAFDRPMRVDTLNDRSAFAVVRWPEQLARSGSQLDLALEAVLPLTVTPLSGYALEVRQIRFVDSRAERRPVELITSVETVGSPPDLVSAVMLSLPGAAWNKVTRFGVSQLTFVLRGDWITDGEGRALDGNHIPPFVPVRRSGNGTGGGDWISTLHVEP